MADGKRESLTGYSVYAVLRWLSARLHLSAQSSLALSLPQSSCLNPERSPTAPSSEGAKGAAAPRTDFTSEGGEDDAADSAAVGAAQKAPAFAGALRYVRGSARSRIPQDIRRARRLRREGRLAGGFAAAPSPQKAPAREGRRSRRDLCRGG